VITSARRENINRIVNTLHGAYKTKEQDAATLRVDNPLLAIGMEGIDGRNDGTRNVMELTLTQEDATIDNVMSDPATITGAGQGSEPRTDHNVTSDHVMTIDASQESGLRTDHNVTDTSIDTTIDLIIHLEVRCRR